MPATSIPEPTNYQVPPGYVWVGDHWEKSSSTTPPFTPPPSTSTPEQRKEGSDSARNFAKGYIPATGMPGPLSKNYADYASYYQQAYPSAHGGQAAPPITPDPSWGGKQFADFTPQERINWWLWKIPPGSPGAPSTRDTLSDSVIDSLNDSQVQFYLRTGKDPRGLSAEQVQGTLNKFGYQSGVAGTGQGALYYYNQPGLWEGLPEQYRPNVTKATSQNLAIEPGYWDLLSNRTFLNTNSYWNAVRNMLDARQGAPPTTTTAPTAPTPAPVTTAAPPPTPRQTVPMSFPSYSSTPVTAQPLAQPKTATPTPTPTPFTSQPLAQTTTGFTPFQLPSYNTGTRTGTGMTFPTTPFSAGPFAPSSVMSRGIILPPTGNFGPIRTMSKPSFNFPSYYNSPGPFGSRRKQPF